MAEVDTSSYLKPGATPQKSGFDIAKDLGGMQSQALTIDKQKLDLINQRYGYLNRELTTLANDPNVTPDVINGKVQNLVNLGILPPQMAATFIKSLPTDPEGARREIQNAITRNMATQEAVNFHYGVPGHETDNQRTTPVLRSPLFGTRQAGPSTQLQVPPTAQGVDNRDTLPDGSPNPNRGAPQFVGARPPELPPGTGPTPGGLPGQFGTPGAAPTNTQPLPTGPVNNPNVLGPSSNFGGNVTGVEVLPPGGLPAPPSRLPVSPPMPVPRPAAPMAQATPGQPAAPVNNFGRLPVSTPFDNRFNAATGGYRNPPPIATGLPPGQAEAMQISQTEGAKDYTSAIRRSSNFNAEMTPALTALDALKQLGPTNVGPGTDAWNNVKSAIVTWLPQLANDPAFNTVKNFDEYKKYLVQIARTSGNTGTNDQLATALSGNPNTSMSGLAAQDVLKTVIALKRMDQAQVLMFGKLLDEGKVKEGDYPKWVGRNQNNLDPRAFAVDQMTDDARKKLRETLNKDPTQKKKFFDSLKFAEEAGLVRAPQ